jgi:hypothetical protein
MSIAGSGNFAYGFSAATDLFCWTIGAFADIMVDTADVAQW